MTLIKNQTDSKNKKKKKDPMEIKKKQKNLHWLDSPAKMWQMRGIASTGQKLQINFIHRIAEKNIRVGIKSNKYMATLC